jgi:hypothetical protein
MILLGACSDDAGHILLSCGSLFYHITSWVWFPRPGCAQCSNPWRVPVLLDGNSCVITELDRKTCRRIERVRTPMLDQTLRTRYPVTREEKRRSNRPESAKMLTNRRSAHIFASRREFIALLRAALCWGFPSTSLLLLKLVAYQIF